MLLIIVHELGHFLTAFFLGIETDKIYLYPYGGITKFQTRVNISRNKEILILVMGPVFQIVFYIILSNYITNSYLSNIFFSYHMFLLFFNLLPIYPLDGGRLFFLVLSFFWPYKKSFYCSIGFSYFILILLIVWTVVFHSFFMTGVLLLLVFKVKKEKQLFPFVFEKFLLERIIYKLRFKNLKMVFNIDDMMLDTFHFFNSNNHIMNELDYLTFRSKKIK